MAQLGEQLAMVLRSGRAVMRMTPKRASQEQASGADELASPNAPMSPGQTDFGAGGQASSPPARFLRRMRTALARVGGGGRPAESVGPASLNFLDVTPERPRRPPEQARLSDVDLQAGASGQILQALHRLAQEVQQVRAEVKEGRAEMEKWRAEMEKTVRTVAQNEAQLRTQILGTAEGLVRVEQKLQEEVAQMCAKLEMMQNEQEKKKGNEEELLKALVREYVEKLAQQLEEKEDAKLQGYQQALEEWLEERMCREIERQKRSQFKLTITGRVDKFLHVAETLQTQVTTVLEKCEKLAEQLRQYETPLKFDDQWPQLEQEGPEQGQPTQKQREAPAELRYETEKLADNDQVEAQEEPTLDVAEVAADAQEMRYEAEKLADNELGDKAASWQTQYQREKSEVSEGTDSCRGSNEGEPSGVAADTQEEPKLDAADAQGVPMLDLNQSEKNEATADAHMVGSRRSTLPYGDRNEHEMIEGRPVYERTKVSEALADASGGSGTEGGMVLELRDTAGVVRDIQVRVDASTSVSQVRTAASHELRRRGVHSKLVSKLLFSGIFLKDDDIVRTTLLAAISRVGSKGLDARPVVHMLLAATSRTPKSILTCLPDGDQEEHETTEFSVKPSSGVGRHTYNGSVSRSTFVISEPTDKNNVHENDAGGSGLSSGGFGASSAAPPSAPAVSGSFAFVVQDEGLDEKESDSDIVIRLQESKLDVQDEAAAAQADAIFDRKADAIVARVAAKLRAEMTQLLSLSQGVAVA